MDNAQSPNDLRRVAVVTGAGRGIGQAIARRLGADGFVVVGAARSSDQLARTAAAIPGMVPVTADVSCQADVERLGAVATRAGRLAVWVNNAAVLEKALLPDLTPAIWDRVLATNLYGTYAGCRVAFGLMAAAGGGVIVNIGSLSGVPAVEKFPGLAAYNVSKAGVIALSEAVALEGLAHGVRCVAISPGAVDTEMLRRAAPRLRAGMTSDDVAAIVSFATTSEGVSLSGTNLTLFSNRGPDV